jgi:hypothetical protein
MAKSVEERARHNAYMKAFMAAHPGYVSWHGMKQRCFNKKHKKYPRYGGRGITVDSRWLGKGGYIRFIEDMGPPPPGTTIDREDNDGHYTKINCRWATPVQQSSNKRNSILITIDGETKTLAAWAQHYGVNKSVAWRRVKRGWDVISAITKPAVLGRNQFTKVM